MDQTAPAYQGVLWDLGAVCVYVLVAIVKKRLGLEHSLYTILQILSVGLFEKTPIFQAFSLHDPTNEEREVSNQLELFNL